MAGYVYASPSKAGIVKIGATTHDPAARLADANSADTWRPPEPYARFRSALSTERAPFFWQSKERIKKRMRVLPAGARVYVSENPGTFALVIVAAVVVLLCIGVGYFLFRFLGGKGDTAPTTPTPTPTAGAAPILPVPLPATTMPPLPMTPVMPDVLMPVDVAAPPPQPKTQVVDAASLVLVLPDAIDVTIESDDPDLRGFSGTYYYSFSSGFQDPRIGAWAWTLDSVAAPGGNEYRGKTRGQLSYSNDDGKWNLSLNTGDPYPEPPVLLRATTGPLDKWSSVWSAKWVRVEPLGTIDSKRPLAMPLIKVSARGTGVVAPWT
jgi:hypothetical protein